MSLFFSFAGSTTMASVSVLSPVSPFATFWTAESSFASLFASLTLTGGAGDDRLTGNWGNDTLFLSGGWDTLDGGSGSDTVDYSAATGTVYLWLPDMPQPDPLDGFGFPSLPNWGPHAPPPLPGPGEAEVLFSDGPRVTQVWGTYDVYWQLNGKRDELVSIENAIGSRFDDTLLGADTDNLLRGGDGADLMDGDKGADTLQGDAGDDRLHGGRGSDLLEGGLGNDLLVDHPLWSGSPAVWYTMALDGAAAAEGADILLGGAGADTLIASGGGDVIRGGEGTDLLVMNFAAGSEAVGFAVVAGGDWTVRLGGVAQATVGTVEALSIEGGAGADAMNAALLGGSANLSGGAGRDTLLGGSRADVLAGGAEADLLRGGGGADRLEGGLGRDTVRGGTGADIFIWNAVAEGGDRVLDFTTRVDLLQVDASGFGGGLQAGGLAAGQLAFGTAATAATAQFVYDQATGRLGWDADGAGGGAAREIATLDPGTALAHTDFLIVA